MEFIAVEDGYWAAHCESLQVGSLADTRSEALRTVRRFIDDGAVIPEFPEYDPRGNKVYPLPAPGHYGF